MDIGKGNILLALKAIYGLPESMRLLCDKLKGHLERFGLLFSRNGNVFTMREGREYVRVGVQVDDMIVFTNSSRLSEKLFKHVTKVFVTKNLGKLTEAMGINFEIDYEKGTAFLHQKKKKEDFLRRLNLENCNLSTTP